MTVEVEKSPPIWTVILDRPAVRNAVDRPTAEALADAFRRFDDDPEARVAVLWGRGGTFCSGADLKAVAAGQIQLTFLSLSASLGQVQAGRVRANHKESFQPATKGTKATKSKKKPIQSS